MAKGLYNNSELVDSIIIDLNNVLKMAVDGQYIQACTTVAMMSQKLVNLRTTIDNDLRGRDQTIEQLKNQLRAMGMEIVEVSGKELIESEKKGE